MTNINKKFINNNSISLDYIAGFVHAYGTFTAPLIKGKKKIYINPRFILTENSEYKYHLNLIKKELDNIGNIEENKSSKIIKYTITNLDDLNNKILPIFNKHQVRGNRYYSYLKFKLLIKILKYEYIEYKSDLWLFCILLTTKINPNVSLNKQINYLSLEEQNIIKSNKIPKGINIENLIKLYCPELESIDLLNNKSEVNNSQPLTKEFINGLFDGNGSLSLRLSPIKNNKLGFKVAFKIIQDDLNDHILKELLKFFNNKGSIIKHKTEKNISYLCYNRTELINNIIPNMLNIKNLLNSNIDWYNIKGPNIKLYKLYNFIEICKLLENNNLNDTNILDKVILLIYNTKKNSAGLTYNQFKENLLK
uniref:Homing endonuclease LAGLIDADG domain-containing protein n=1 Tax=Wickerhamomyces mucosus TaxID=1378264 RepID=S5TF65_9ASCO|nr:hypothetical protein [Wickerhamomyces mucosus]AGS44509.1 hypothetical protein [Wickerhamomyces mucosus]